MWQHKQEERELKRTEGDIIKNQRAVRHTLRDFENGKVFHVILIYCMLDYFCFSIQSHFYGEILAPVIFSPISSL